MMDNYVNFEFNLFYMPQIRPVTEPELQPIWNAFQHGRLDEALKQLDMLIRQNPKMATGYYYRALIYFAKKKLARTMNDCKLALKHDSQLVEAYLMRGVMYILSNRPQMAFNDFETAISLKPNLPDAYLGRGMALYFWGENERRIHSFNRIIDYRYGVTQFNDAFNDLSYALSLNLNDYQIATAHWGLAFVYSRLQQIDQALPHMNLVVTMMPNHAYLLRERGFMYAQAGLYDQALADIEAALQLNPRDRLAQSYYRQVMNQKRK